MANTKSAKKKLRQDIKRTKRNLRYKLSYKRIIKELRKLEEKEDFKDLLSKAYSYLDKAAKKNIIHKNKASRLKSRITKLVLRKNFHEKISH